MTLFVHSLTVRHAFSRLLVLALIALGLLIGEPVPAATQLMLSGSVAKKCTIAVTAAPEAATLALEAGVQHVPIGSVLQDCNGRRGYTLEVLSSNCLAAPQGAKLLTGSSASGLSYSVEAHNPTNGGSAAVVTGLLSTACTGQIARDVTHALIKDETSTLYVNYTGGSGLDAGLYQDVLTISLTTK